MNFPKDEVDVVIYHHPCNDGFASAFVVYLYYKLTKNTRHITYLGANYSDMWPAAATAGKNVVIADFSYPLNVLNNALGDNAGPNSLIIIDHHKTSQNALSALQHEKAQKIFNMNYSGCGLTWEFFFGSAPTEPLLEELRSSPTEPLNPKKIEHLFPQQIEPLFPQQMPYFLQMIQDNDIWKHSLKDTKEFITFLRINQLSFELFEHLLDENNLHEAISKGASYLEYETKLIEKAANRATIKFVRFDSVNQKKFAVVAHVESAECKSEVGNKLVRDYPLVDFSVVMQYNPYKQLTLCSLRSSDTGVDVSDLSKEFLGGGGHRNASGAALKGMWYCISNRDYNVPNIYKVLLAAKFKLFTGKICVCSIVAPSMNTQHPLGMYLLQKRYITNTAQEINNATHLYAMKPAEEKLPEIPAKNPTENPEDTSADIPANIPVHVVSVATLNELGELIINIYFDSRFVKRDDFLTEYLSDQDWKEVEQPDETSAADLGNIQLVRCVKVAKIF